MVFRFEVLCLVPVLMALEFSWSKHELGPAVLLFGGEFHVLVHEN